MSSGNRKLLFDAVQNYKKHASSRLSAEDVKRAVVEIKSLNDRLPLKNILLSNYEEISAAGRAMMAEGKSQSDMLFLKNELLCFFDTAMEGGFTGYHPLRKTARIHTSGSAAAVRTESTGIIAGASHVADLVGGIIEESIQKGLMISPLAIPLAEMGDKGSLIDRLVSNLSGRWALMAYRMRFLLAGLRYVIPVLAMYFALNAWFSDDNPMIRAERTSGATRNAIQKLTILVVNMNPGAEYGGRSEYRDLMDLGDRHGIDLEKESEVLTLLKFSGLNNTLYLRHEPSGAIVMISQNGIAQVKEGRFRRVK